MSFAPPSHGGLDLHRNQTTSAATTQSAVAPRDAARNLLSRDPVPLTPSPAAWTTPRGVGRHNSMPITQSYGGLGDRSNQPMPPVPGWNAYSNVDHIRGMGSRI